MYITNNYLYAFYILYIHVRDLDPYPSHFSGAGHHAGDDGGAGEASPGLFHVPLGGHDEDHHVGHLPRADRSLLPHQRTGKEKKDNH